MTTLVLASALNLAVGLVGANAQSIVQEFFIPLPEEQVRGTLLKLYTGTGATFDSVVSIVVNTAGTRVIYDQWEDGYEVDLNSPVQSTTKIWGDGNNANGIAPGYANDPASLPAGAVLALRNNVTLPRSPSAVLYDGRDRVGATKAIVISRAAWALTPGSVLAGAVEVSSTLDYGMQFVSPVGENVSASSMFEVVDLYVMAAENGTMVSIDKDANGSYETVVTLNRGESYRVNGGVLKGARVSSSKRIQAHLITGDIGANYESRWFTLYPVEQWSGTYYSPVGTAGDGDQAYVFLYNPGAAAITVNVATRVGNSSVSVPANGSYQYLMPQGSGARFQSAGGEPFFALETVGANPSANNVHDWGFTLVPEGNLTTIGMVGWGPGSSDLSQNGSPVWVTVVHDTTVYVDFNGDRAGPYTDPKGNAYDVAYNLAALESKTIYDPDKDQTGMRVYTVDGTLLTAAWGQDPVTAAPGNPFLDLGTTVLPFPEAIMKKSSTLAVDRPPAGLSTNDTMEYAIEINNNSVVVLGNVIVLDTPPASLSYVLGSSSRDGAVIADNTVPPAATAFPFDESGYVIPVIPRGSSTTIKYQARILAAGPIPNSVVNGDTIISNVVVVPPPAGATPCSLNFTDGSGTPVSFFAAGADVYVTLEDADANREPGVAESAMVVVQNAGSGDLETISLVETGPNSGVFRNAAALPSSTTAGLAQQDGSLYVQPGQTLSVGYTDPLFGDVCGDTAAIPASTQTKVLYLSTDGTGSPDQDLDRIDPVAAADASTATSVVLTAGGAITLLNKSTASSNEATAALRFLTLSHVTSNAANRLMLVGISYEDDNTAGFIPTNVQYIVGSVTQQLQLVTQRASSQESASQIWSLPAPAVGAGTVRVAMSDSATNDGDAIYVGVATFSGVDWTAPLRSSNSNTAATSPASVVVTSVVGDVVFDVLALDDSRAATNASGQTWIWSGIVGTADSDGVRAAASMRAGGAPRVTNSWTITVDAWADVGVSIRPAMTGGATNRTVFIQTPALCDTLTLPAGGTLSITNFLRITAGTMPALPAITARLLYGTNVVATLANPVFSSSNSNLVWTTVLPAAINIPGGQAVALEITSAQDGVSFAVLYDSVSKPSKIMLPATTVIHVTSMGVYDAPYPAGNLATSPNNGARLYVRVKAADPFGAYDITSVNLAIDGPGTGGDVAATLQNAQVVASDACSKVYEYVWQTGSTEGNYTISATANEGTEGVTDTAATAVTLSSLDLGTPCVLDFTAGNNGPVTASYPTNGQVCVRVSDLDQNLNPLAFDTVNAILVSSSGDTEPLLLTETATNSGLFTACINTSVSGGVGGTNGVLNAPAGAVLTVSYADPDTPSDVCTATAVIQRPAGTPAVSVTKTLISPADGQGLVGDAVRYRLRVVNSGSTTLTPVRVVDTFPSANLGYLSASPTPNIVAAGSLTWTNVGPMTPGQIIDLQVNFSALAIANPATNAVTVTANGGSPTASDTEPVVITKPSVTVAKKRLNPPSGPVQIGGTITYQVVVSNNGTTAITTLPLQDQFSGACFTYVSATPSADAAGYGSLLWDDLTGAGSLAPGGALTVSVTLRAAGGCDPADNLAAVYYAVDQYGDAAPPVDSTASVTTMAARITGKVYNDPDLSGTVTSGDTALAGVVVRLYTDPNGDGDPSDGVLVDLTTTLPDGTYEFRNLPAGRYVVVEEDLFSFVSTGDVTQPNDNRIPVNVVDMIAYTGKDFFDAQIPAIQIEKTVSATGSIPGGEMAQGTNGTPVTYTFVVSNIGSLTLTDAVINDASLVYATNLGALAIGQSKTVTVATVMSADLTNSAQVVAGYAGGGTISDADTAVVDVIHPAVAVSKTASAAGPFPGGEVAHGTIGSPVTYWFVVSNPGDVTLTNVTLNDAAVPFSAVIGTLVAGQSVTASVADTISADLTNTAAVTGGDPFGYTRTGADQAVVDAVLPAIQVVKTAGPAADGQVLSVNSGANVVYAYRVINAGDTYLSNIEVTDNVLGAVGAVAGPLAPAAEVVLYATNLNVTADVTNIADAQGTPSDAGGASLGLADVTDSDDAIVDVVHPAIQVVKTAGAAADGQVLLVNSGADVVYAYRVINAGDTYLSNIEVTDNVLGAVGTVAGPLAPAAEVMLYATNLNVTADVTNIADAQGTPSDTGGASLGLADVTDSDNAVVDVVHPAIQVVKTAGAATDGQVLSVLSGTDVVYAYRVINAGDTYLSDIEVTDNVLGAVGTVAGPLAPAAEVVLYATNLSVTADVTNIADAQGTPSDAGGASLGLADVTDSDNAVVDIVLPAIQVVKTAGAAADGQVLSVNSGADVVYAYRVINAGDTYLSNLEVTDNVLGAVGTVAGPLAPAAEVMLYATNLNVTADVTNIADAQGTPSDAGGASLGLADVTDSDDAVVDVVHPAIQVVKTAGAAADGATVKFLSGTDVVYTYRVINAGDTYLSDIEVTDNVLGAVGTVAGPLAPAAEVVLYATNLNVTADVTNIADAQGTPSDAGGVSLGVADVTDSDDAVVDVVHPAIQVVKTAGPVADGEILWVYSGADVVYTYRVINAGDTYLSDIEVADNVLGAVGTVAGPLAPAAETVLYATNLHLTAAVTNIASAQGTPCEDDGTSLGFPGVSDQDDAVANVLRASFAVDKTLISPSNRMAAWVGEELVFVITVTNNGNARLETVPLVDRFDTADMAFVSAVPAPSSVAAGVIVWGDLGALDVGAVTKVTTRFTALRARFPAETTNTATATATATNGIALPPRSDDSLFRMAVQGTIHYVSTNGGSVGEYLDWNSAATNVQDAVDVAAPGHFVIVSNGIYMVTSTVSIIKDIYVGSVNGPETTVWDASLRSNRVVYLAGSNAVLEGVTLTGGSTREGGGGAMIKSNALIRDCIVISNWVGNGKGGGINGGRVEDCVVMYNDAAVGYGGGVAFATVTNSLIAYNQGDFGGGAYYTTIYDSRFIGNSAENVGGGSYRSTNVNCYFEGNYGGSGGGVVYGFADTCVFYSNTAVMGAGTFKSIVQNSTIVSNIAKSSGGGTYMSTNVNCEIAFNTAQSGGGVCFGWVWDSRITANAARLGGGIYGGYAENSYLTANTASQSGGGVYNAQIRNGLLVGNNAVYGGGSAHSALESSTVVSNYAQNGGGLYGGSALNSIVYFNAATKYGPNVYVAALTNSCTTPVPVGNNNITNDPQFASGSFQLSDASPCIGLGTNRAWMAAAVDLDGHARIIAGATDMGAYEHVVGGRKSAMPTLFNIAPTPPVSFTMSGATAATASSGGGVTLSWTSYPGLKYTVMTTTNLVTGPWVPCAEVLGTGEELVYQRRGSGRQEFITIVAEAPKLP